MLEKLIKNSMSKSWAVTNGSLVGNTDCSSNIARQLDKFWACERNKANLQLISQSLF